MGLVGESGSGKTTVGRAILKLIKATSGDVLFDGKPILPLNESQFRPLRGEMQMIFQDPYASLNPRMTCGAIIGEASRDSFSRDDEERPPRPRGGVAEPSRSRSPRWLAVMPMSSAADRGSESASPGPWP